MSIRSLKKLVLYLALCGCISGAAAADSIEAFYKGRTVEVYIGSSPGGGYDLYGRLVARHLGEQLPGNPTLIAKNLPGGGGFRMLNGAYKGASRDGSILLMVPQALAIAQALGEDGVNYDARKLNYIGRLAPVVGIIYTWHTSPTKTLEDARGRETLMGGTGPLSPTVTNFKALNVLAGTKFKVVSGYRSGSEIDLAMERGEVEGGTTSWASVKVGNKDWLKEKKINLLLQFTTEAAPDLQNVPMAVDLGQNELDRKALQLLAVGNTTGRSVATLLEVPTERVEALRSAFLKMVKAKGFMAEVQKRQIDLGPMSGQDLQKLIEDTINTPADVVARAKKARAG